MQAHIQHSSGHRFHQGTGPAHARDRFPKALRASRGILIGIGLSTIAWLAIATGMIAAF